LQAPDQPQLHEPTPAEAEAAAAAPELPPPPPDLSRPPDPPRELTPLVRRRAWTEPRVRLWWLFALGVLLVSELSTWWSERRLLTSGVQVKAVITSAQDKLNHITVPDKNMPSDSVCTLEFTLDGKPHTVRGVLAEHRERGSSITTGPKHPVALRVDPADPQRWTDRTVMPALAARQFIGALIGAPVAALLALLAVLKRRATTAVWRSGPAGPALVLGVGQTPVAPRSRSVRCTAADSNDKRVFTVYLPAGAAPVEGGDLLWVVRPAGRSSPVYAAGWFLRDGDA
jgi:hypothetical protein